MPALTIRGLLDGQLRSPAAVRFVKIGRNRVVRQSQFDSALLSDDGTTTRYFLADGGATVRNLVSARRNPLEVFVHKGVDIAVQASASRKRVSVGESIRFRARVKAPSPHAQYSYTWQFGDGATATGATVTHAYDAAFSGAVQVTVQDSDPGCNPACNGDDRVLVQVGDAPKRRKAPEPTPGGATGSPGGAGSSAGTGGGGQGGSGGDASGTGTGSRAERGTAAAKRTPPPPPERPFGTQISGVLIEDPGTTVRKLPDGTPAGAPKGVRRIRGGAPGRSIELPLSALLALGMISLGALRERRGVRMRVA